jgi:hypothetical protein
MRRWSGTFESGSLPDQISNDFQRWAKNTLKRHAVPWTDAKEIASELTDVVSFAYVGRKHKLEQTGAGRPLNGAANLLSVEVAAVLSKYGIRGNWVDPGWAGNTGLVAELEAIAQTALRQACGEASGVAARPARISKARTILGKVHRN